MPAWMFIALFLVFFVVSFLILLKYDDFLAVFYVSLFLYTIFTQIGYGAFPEIAIRAGVYFGEDIFYDYWWFISLSFILIFGLLLVVVNLKSPHQFAFRMVRRPLLVSDFILYGLGGGFILYMIYYILSNQNSLTYIFVTSSEGGQVFAFASGLLNLLMLAYYVKFRRFAHSRSAKAWALIFFGVSLSLLFARSILSGDRSLLFTQFLAFASFELMPFRYALRKASKKLAVIGIVGVLSLFVMDRIALVRGYGDFTLALFADPSIKKDVSTNALDTLVRQDYFAPSLLLTASMYNKYIDPAEVILSNFNNTLVFQNYPYLSETVGRLLGPTSRKQGSAYYILTEGYNFAGWWGILYNGIIIVALLVLWRLLKSSDNVDFNRFITTIMISLMIPMVRGQTSYFLKNIYMILVPAIFLYYLVSGYLPSLRTRMYVALTNQTR